MTCIYMLLHAGKVIGTTVIENAALLESELGAVPCAFKPSIPNLVSKRGCALMCARMRRDVRFTVHG